MEIKEILTGYIEQCKEAIEKKKEIEEEYDLEAESTEPIDRRYLRYVMDVNSMKIQILGNYLRDLSHPDLSLLVAVYQCITGGYEFPEDVPSIRQTNQNQEALIGSIREKNLEEMISCLEDALEKVEEEGVDLDL